MLPVVMQPGFTIDVLTLEARRFVDFLDIQSFQTGRKLTTCSRYCRPSVPVLGVRS
ncbi:hypothetical protein C4K04_0247 [Pseudomonas chlororaphis]|uniref:Uncharacterized protein n=1 Tax=Pseudomonas chlororaphis TaxID=587753 RepID=A0A3G7TGG7_9PSED|nr:hypothetical protein C4K04_0247 [Pseudomonas chlororaphis]